MRVIGIKALKNQLSEYVKLAAAGERVLVTDRDRVVAELIAPRPGVPESGADALLAETVRAGIVSPPLLPREMVPLRAPVAPLHQIQHELSDDRSDR